MKRKTKIIVSALVGIIFIPAWIYTIYLVFFDKSEVKPGDTEKQDITTYQGNLSELGPTNSRGLIFTMSEYSHLVIGGTEVRQLAIVDELRNTLSSAILKNCTLYVYKSTIIGVSLPNGRTYCADYKRGALWNFLGWGMGILGVPLIFALGLGILALILAYGLVKRGQLYSRAAYLPGGIILNS